MLEPDSESDSMDQQYSEMKISGVAEGEDRERDVREWEKQYSDILTKEPGLTNLTEFKMDTGNTSSHGYSAQA